ncbi:MAG: BPL-N domain-containing protein [Candidatus Pacearchaeota archaeon]
MKGGDKKIYEIKKYIFVFYICLVIASTMVFVLAKPPSVPTCPINSNTNVVFYGETGFGGVGDLSRSWIIHFLDWWKLQDSNIIYQELKSSDVKNCNLANYPNLKIYIQPGGNAYYQQRSLSTEGKTNINNYINSGKAYVGICAGFYYAASDYYWQGSYYDWGDLLGKYPTVEGSILEIADYDSNTPYKVTTLSNGENMVYYGGPTRGYKDTPNTIIGEKLMSFSELSGELPAAIKSDNLLLMSVHAEAFENDGITGLSSEQRVRNYIWFANSINNVASTNFIVPSLPNPPVCGNLVCEQGEDSNNCIVDCPIGNLGEIFFEDFENGFSSWILTKVSAANYWSLTTTNPYQGSYSAEVKPMSTTEPASSIEKAVSTSGFSNLKLSYYRRLIGLDIADEFKVKWYDGTTWFVLEQTGSSSANDASYLSKEFSLPSSANNNPNFRIRFECTAGATSEFCRVDNIKLTSN